MAARLSPLHPRYRPETPAPKGLPTQSWLLHGIGVTATIAGGWWLWQRYLRYVATMPPRASSDDGIWFGWVAAGLMTFLTLYGVRRGILVPARWLPTLYRLPLGNLQSWLWLHVYLSLLCALAIGCHIGWRVKGGLFYWLLIASLIVAFVSGFFGVVAYTLLREGLTRVEGQPLYVTALRRHHRWLSEVIAHLREGKSFAESVDAVEAKCRETDGLAQTAAWLYELAHLLAKLRRTPQGFVRDMERWAWAMMQSEDNERQRERWKSAAVQALAMLLENAPEGQEPLLAKLRWRMGWEIALQIAMRGWIVLHAIAALVAFLLMVAHIVTAFYL
jgi:hypothetical protein